MKRAVIYARYSNKRLQDGRSIDDQISEGTRQLVERHGCKVIKTYTDAGISGESISARPGLMALVEDAKKQKFDVVFVETTSRLCREDEDSAFLRKLFKFSEITLITMSGVVSDIQSKVSAIVDSEFNENLRIMVRNRMTARVREGKIPGTVTYGYRGVLETLANGLTRFRPGVREIDPDRAAVVLRIFTEYANGRSPRDICADLTRDGVPTPRGAKHWNPGKIVAPFGFINNQMYVGKIVWNQHIYVKHPVTRKRVQKLGKEENVVTTDAPHLRIIPQDLWDRAHALRTKRSEAKFGRDRKRTYNFKSAEKFFLIGLLRCATCGGNMMIGNSNMDGSPRVVCSYGQRRMGCDHHKSYCLKTLEATVLAGIKARLTQPAAVIEYTKSYHKRWAERQREIAADRADVRRKLDAATHHCDRLLALADDDDTPIAALKAKLKEAEAKRVMLAEQLAQIDKETNVIDLHPKAVQKFCTDMTTLHDILFKGKPGEQMTIAQAAFRNVFEGIVVHPTAKRKPYEITPYARLSAITGIDLFPKVRTTAKMLAEIGASTNRLSEPSRNRWGANSDSRTLPLGRWCQAA